MTVTKTTAASLAARGYSAPGWTGSESRLRHLRLRLPPVGSNTRELLLELAKAPFGLKFLKERTAEYAAARQLEDLGWARVRWHEGQYHVQLVAGAKRILSAWPVEPPITVLDDRPRPAAAPVRQAVPVAAVPVARALPARTRPRSRLVINDRLLAAVLRPLAGEDAHRPYDVAVLMQELEATEAAVLSVLGRLLTMQYIALDDDVKPTKITAGQAGVKWLTAHTRPRPGNPVTEVA